MHNTSRVLLPAWMFEREDKEQLIKSYIKRNYPNYRIERIEGKFAICRG